MSRGVARVVAVLSGFVVLGVEVTALRIVAPYFGASIFITTNILAVILAGLAIGYAWGGRLADRFASRDGRSGRVRSMRALGYVLVGTALLLALLPIVAPSLLALGRGFISGIDWSLIVVSLLGSALLFLVPTVLLGMVSPWLVRLVVDRVEHTGRRAGSLFAWSTVGSLLGTFAPTLVLVPLLGTRRTMLLLAALLALTGALVLARSRWFAPAVALVLLMPLVTPRYFAEAANVLVERESSTGYLRVISDGEQRVHLEQDEGFGVHSVYDPERLTTNMVFDWFALAPALRAADATGNESLRVGLVGLAGATSARQYAAWYGPAGADPHSLSLSGVELDPATVALAREYFALDTISPPVEVATGDGRVWLARQPEGSFDVLILDAFRQLYVPPHLSTREAFTLVRQRLAPGGVAVINLNVTSRDSLVYRAVSATLRDVFPQVLAVSVPNSYNVVFFAAEHALNPAAVVANTRVPELAEIAGQFADRAETLAPAEPSLVATDDRPLTESVYDLMVALWLFGE